MAKIVWNTVSFLKSEGGLGMRDFVIWNKIFCFKLIWRLYVINFFFWVIWIRKYKIGNDNFWNFDVKKVGFFIWRLIFNFRFLVLNFLRADFGDGKNISFWWDYWISFGRLIDLFGSIGFREFFIFLFVTVSDFCDDNGWRFRGVRFSVVESL